MIVCCRPSLPRAVLRACSTHDDRDPRDARARARARGCKIAPKHATSAPACNPFRGAQRSWTRVRAPGDLRKTQSGRPRRRPPIPPAPRTHARPSSEPVAPAREDRSPREDDTAHLRRRALPRHPAQGPSGAIRAKSRARALVSPSAGASIRRASLRVASTQRYCTGLARLRRGAEKTHLAARRSPLTARAGTPIESTRTSRRRPGSSPRVRPPKVGTRRRNVDHAARGQSRTAWSPRGLRQPGGRCAVHRKWQAAGVVVERTAEICSPRGIEAREGSETAAGASSMRESAKELSRREDEQTAKTCEPRRCTNREDVRSARTRRPQGYAHRRDLRTAGLQAWARGSSAKEAGPLKTCESARSRGARENANVTHRHSSNAARRARNEASRHSGKSTQHPDAMR
ncbi:hypothetical protein CERSUDRAFT_110983 [Gelatoporia subvermispora B]|uniref:Uncharacterized protein n=1 Tax=Ceriporiopsis subvermispora (strain B) TaxID=914234 RepID=M2RNE0_CERS8|nr:hypothetical protein CERSUDRAFT_110983 [Gelatoporia subvermispora B]